MATLFETSFNKGDVKNRLSCFVFQGFVNYFNDVSTFIFMDMRLIQ